MDRLLVTGGLGFIGSNFIRNRIESFPDSHILNLDSMSYGANRQNLANEEDNSRYQFVKCDLRDSRKIGELVSSADAIINFAAETHVDRSISNPSAFLESNVIGTYTLLEAAKKSNVRRFIQISTDEVYGPALCTKSFDEESTLNPSSPYAASKAAADLFVMSYNRTYSLPTIILRCTNNFGPYQFPEKFIPKTIISSMLGKRISIYGDGSQVRDWICVSDFCNAINLAIERGQIGTIYNVSGGNELPNLAVATKILNFLDKTPDLIHFVEDRPGHDVRYSLDSHQIREKLGWRPRFVLEDALRATVNWYLANESWWKPLLNDKLFSSTPWKENW